MTTTPRPAALALLAGALILAACSGESTEPTAAPTGGTAAAKGGPNALPSNGRLYFIQDFGAASYEVFSVNQDGSGSRRLTYTDGFMEYSIAVSGDGKKLVTSGSVAALVNGQLQTTAHEIWTMNTDGSNRRRVLSQPCTQTQWACYPLVQDATFSPDGRTIAYSYYSETEQGIFAMSASGSGTRKLLDDGYKPSFSPDGKRIAFLEATAQGTLSIANVDGSDRQVLDTCPTGNGGCVDPSWSPDGSRIVTWTNGENENRFYSFVWGGSIPQQVWMGVAPTWSPDGSAIAGIIPTSTPAGLRYQLTITPVGASSGKVAYEGSGIVDVAWGR